MNTTPLQKELQKLEVDRLKTEHQHQQRVKGLRSEYNLLEAKIPALRELVSKLDTDVEKTLKAKGILQKDLQKLETVKATLVIDISAKEKRIENLQSEYIVLESQVSKKRSEIDSELEDYTNNRRLELESTLVEKQVELTNVESALAAAHTTIKSLSDRANKQNDEFEKAKQIHVTTLTSLENDQQNAVKETIEFESKITKLRTLVKELSYQKATYESSIEKIRLEGKQFADYEIRARKILDVKDRELQEREQNIQIGEQHLQTRRSFLPKL